MTVTEQITTRVQHLTPRDQKEILALVERMEIREKIHSDSAATNGNLKHPLTEIADLAIDMGITDFADRHDFYAHGKIED